MRVLDGAIPDSSEGNRYDRQGPRKLPRLAECAELLNTSPSFTCDLRACGDSDRRIYHERVDATPGGMNEPQSASS